MQLHTGRFNSRCKLKRPAEYNLVFRSPCRSSDKNLLIIAKKNGLNHARIGLAISKKKLKLAVDRNRLKRLIRESFRKNQQLLAGLDIVVTTNRQTSTSNMNNRMIFESLQKHWQKLAACKESL